MKDPQRLLAGGGTDVERTLLEAGNREEPSRRSMRAAAAAIGLGAAAGLSAQSAAGAGAATIVVHVTEALKWVGAGLLGIGVVAAVGLAIVAQRGEDVVVVTPPPAASEKSATEVGAKPLAPEPAAKQPQEQPPAVADEPDRVASAAPPPKPQSGGSLRDQVALVDEARQKLGSGQPQGAIVTLNRYQRDFPRGALGQEAMLLRIEALAQMGDRSAARALAGRFLTSQPSSPHRKRIESLVGKIEVEP